MIRKQSLVHILYSGFLILTLGTMACSKNSLSGSDNEKVLNAPQGLTITSQPTSAVFNWTSDPEAYGYILEISQGTTFTTAVFHSDTLHHNSITVDGLVPASTYICRLRAVHRHNPSLSSKNIFQEFSTLAGNQEESPLAFPGADGYGKNTTGGRGGRVIKVTNLNDAGTGSLRDAINQSGKRIIVFEVAGNIILNSRLQIKNGDVTIAGQSAPGDGICIQNYEVLVDADNVIIQFIRFRMGDLQQQESDALWGRYRNNIMIDHCSMSWSIDECSSFYANKNFTMQWCILSESLNKSFHEKDDHGYGAIWGGHQASFHHNLLAHHNSRNPRFDGGNRPGTGGLSPVGMDKVDYRNNVIYNWRDNSAYGGENGAYNIVNNYYKPGPVTPSSKNARIIQIYKESDAAYSPGYGIFYIHGNHVAGNTTVSQNNWNGVDVASGVTQAMTRQSTPFDFIGLQTTHTAEQAYEAVLAKSGASFKRDAVDIRIIQEVQNGTTTFNGSKTGYQGIIDSQTDVGSWPVLAQGTAPLDSDGDGMPDEWETANGLDSHTPNANGRNLHEQYDNIEVYLHSLVAHLY